MSRDFTHSIKVPGRGMLLSVTVTATVGDAGSLDRWGLEVNHHPQSVTNRDTLRRMLRRVCRDTVSGDNIGAEWETPDRLRIWDVDRHWSLTAKQASNLCDEIERTIGRWCKEMEPVREAVAAVTAAQTWGQPDEILAATRAPPANDVTWQERRIAELQQELREARQMSAILRARITSLNHKLEKRERDGDEP